MWNLKQQQKMKPIDTGNRLVVAGGVGGGIGEGKMSEGGSKVQTSNYKISHEDIIHIMVNIVNNTALHI